MQLNISEKTENPLLACTELRGMIAYDNATPSRADVRSEIGTALKVDKNLVVINNIDSSFGARTARVHARVYKSEDDLKKFVPNYLVARNQKEAKEEKKEEAPAEEKKEAEPASAETKEEAATENAQPQENVEENKEETKKAEE